MHGSWNLDKSNPIASSLGSNHLVPYFVQPELIDLNLYCKCLIVVFTTSILFINCQISKIFVSPKVELSFSLMSNKLMSLKTRITNINLEEIKQGLY